MKTSYNEFSQTIVSNQVFPSIERVKMWPCYLWTIYKRALIQYGIQNGCHRRTILLLSSFIFMHHYNFENFMNEICFNCNVCVFLSIICILQFSQLWMQARHPRWPPKLLLKHLHLSGYHSFPGVSGHCWWSHVPVSYSIDWWEKQVYSCWPWTSSLS